MSHVRGLGPHPGNQGRSVDPTGFRASPPPPVGTRPIPAQGPPWAAFRRTDWADKFGPPGHVQPLHVSHESWGDVARTSFPRTSAHALGCRRRLPELSSAHPYGPGSAGRGSPGFLSDERSPAQSPAGQLPPDLRGSRPWAPRRHEARLPAPLVEGQFGHNVGIQTGVGPTRPVCGHRCQGSGEPRGRTETPEDGRTEGASWRTAAVYIVSQPVGLRRTGSWMTPLRAWRDCRVVDISMLGIGITFDHPNPSELSGSPDLREPPRRRELRERSTRRRDQECDGHHEPGPPSRYRIHRIVRDRAGDHGRAQRHERCLGQRLAH